MSFGLWVLCDPNSSLNCCPPHPRLPPGHSWGPISYKPSIPDLPIQFHCSAVSMLWLSHFNLPIQINPKRWTLTSVAGLPSLPFHNWNLEIKLKTQEKERAEALSRECQHV